MANQRGGLEFCKEYKKSIELKEKYSLMDEDTKFRHIMFGDSIPSFELHRRDGSLNVMGTCPLLTLDEEDLAHLYEKYSKLKEKALKSEIDSLTERYKNI